MTTLDLAAARHGLSQQPFSVLLGARVVSFGDGEAIIELDIRTELLQQNGYLHGGVLAYAADNTLTFVAATTLGPAILTAGFTIDYVRPAQGKLLRARANVVQASRARATCRCDLTTVDVKGTETLCALAQGTIRVST